MLHTDEFPVRGRFLSKGGSACVCEGSYKGEQVAIKYLMMSDEVNQYFQAELKIFEALGAARLQDTEMNVIQMHMAHQGSLQFIVNGDVIDFHSLFVFDYMPNGDLFDYLFSETSCSIDLKTSFALDMTKSLYYIHKNGIIHRDIKIENFLVAADLHVHLADFGLSIFANNTTKKQKIVGTPPYVAPEIVTSDNPQYSYASDMYALSIALYQAISELPFYGEEELKLIGEEIDESMELTHQQQMKLTAENIRPPLENIGSQLFAIICEKCWSSNPCDRPKAEEMVALIEEEKRHGNRP